MIRRHFSRCRPRSPATYSLRDGIGGQGGLRETARRALARGDMATILLMTPSLQPHRMVIADGGWWEQRGGLWGPSRPGDPPVLLAGWDARCTRERGNLLDLASE